MFELGNAGIIGKRDNQEDYFASLPMDNGLLSIVADGMGGYEGGEVASSISVKSFLSFFKENFREDKIEELLVLSTNYANEHLESIKNEDDSLADMGNTLIATYATKSTLYWINVGDSILYRYRKGELVRINADHSVAGELQEEVDKGLISQEEADSSPNRHALTSALTGYEIPFLEQSQIKLEDDDIFILASDGLHTLSQRQIETIILNRIKPQEIADILVGSIEKKGMPNQDNTVVLVFQKEKVDLTKKIPNTAKSKEKTSESKEIINKEKKGKINFVIIFLSAIIVLLISSFFYIKHEENNKLNIITLYDRNQTIDTNQSISPENNKTTNIVDANISLTNVNKTISLQQ
ncbi:MAG TPA: serine/threonine-protein phosphatase [Arcobacter sp.]|nr:serine/threonine-protein phosphatase [Arcobacter sp.]